MKKNVLAVLLFAAGLALVGCGSKDDDFDPNKIAVKQEGSGPPPMAPPGAPSGN